MTPISTRGENSILTIVLTSVTILPKSDWRVTTDGFMKSFVLLKNYYHNKNYDKLDSKLEKLSLDRPGYHESQKKSYKSFQSSISQDMNDFWCKNILHIK